MAGAELAHRLAQARKLFRARDAGPGQRVLDYRRCRQGRAIRPDLAGQVEVGAHGGAGLRQPVFDLVPGGDRHAVPGHRQHVAVMQLLLQPFQMLGRVRHAQLHQRDAAAGELLLGLREIARVGPQSGLLAANDEGAGRSVETGQPCPRRPVRRQVFGQMRIGTGNEHGSDAVLLHGHAQGGETGGDGIVHPVMLAGAIRRFHACVAPEMNRWGRFFARHLAAGRFCS